MSEDQPTSRTFKLPQLGVRPGFSTRPYPYAEVDNLGNLSIVESKEARTLWLPKQTAVKLTEWLSQVYTDKPLRPEGQSR